METIVITAYTRQAIANAILAQVILGNALTCVEDVFPSLADTEGLEIAIQDAARQVNNVKEAIDSTIVDQVLFGIQKALNANSARLLGSLVAVAVAQGELVPTDTLRDLLYLVGEPTAVADIDSWPPAVRTAMTRWATFVALGLSPVPLKPDVRAT